MEIIFIHVVILMNALNAYCDVCRLSTSIVYHIYAQTIEQYMLYFELERLLFM